MNATNLPDGWYVRHLPASVMCATTVILDPEPEEPAMRLSILENGVTTPLTADKPPIELEFYGDGSYRGVRVKGNWTGHLFRVKPEGLSLRECIDPELGFPLNSRGRLIEAS